MSQLSEDFLEKLNLKEVKGKVIGIALKEDFLFILKEKGEEGVKKIEEEMEKLGFNLKFKEIKNFNWYPEEMNILLPVAQEVFGWQDEMMREMGRWTAKISFIAKLMLKYFISLNRIVKEIPGYWRKYHTKGDLEVEKFSKKEKSLILVLKNFNTIAQSHCRYLEGYFWQIASYMVPKEKLKVEETECVFKNGKVHKFNINW
jgi:hypothetical protein